MIGRCKSAELVSKESTVTIELLLGRAVKSRLGVTGGADTNIQQRKS